MELNSTFARCDGDIIKSEIEEVVPAPGCRPSSPEDQREIILDIAESDRGRHPARHSGGVSEDGNLARVLLVGRAQDCQLSIR